MTIDDFFVMRHPLTIDGQEYRLTTESAYSSHGRPVLIGTGPISGDGLARGPGDTCRLRVEAGTDTALADLAAAGFEFDDCRS